MAILRETRITWTALHLLKLTVIRQDKACIKKYDPIGLNKVLNALSAVVWKDSTFLDTMKALVNYICVSELEY